MWRAATMLAVGLALAGCEAPKNKVPFANLSGPDTVRVGAPASFDGTASTDPEGAIAAYFFEFGDGTFTPGESGVVSHTYRKAGKYTVTLTVHDGGGAEHTITRELVVTQNLGPVAAFTAPDSGRVNTAVALDGTGSSDPDGEVVAWAWDLDMDGDYDDASGAQVSWTHRSAGKHTLGLQVRDNDGASATAMAEITIDANLAPLAAFTGPTELVALETGSFAATGAKDPDGTLVKYEWDLDYDHITFVAERSGASINASFTQGRTFWVALRVTDNEGQEAIAAAEVEVRTQAEDFPPPVAMFSGPLTARELDPVGFDAGESKAEGGSIALYEWDFDYQDGDFEAMAAGSAVTHAFPEPGQAVVALRITGAYKDGSSTQGLTTRAITILANAAPAALFVAPTQGEVGIPVTFDASTSFDADGQIVAREWDFSYNNVAFLAEASGVVATHAFAGAGSFIVGLRVTDQNGAQAIATRALLIVANQPPLADLAGPTTATAGEAIVLSAAGSKDPDGILTTYRWDFEGDGKDDQVSTAATATHTYGFEDQGHRKVRLTVVDDDKAEAVATWDLLVKTVAEASPPPVASFTAPSQVRQDGPALFDGSGATAWKGTITAYEWDFSYTTPAAFTPDDQGISVSHVFADPGSQLVALRITVKYADGSEATGIASRTLEVTANQVPVASVSGKTKAVVGDPVSFDGSGSTDDDGSVVTWEWDFDYSGDPAGFGTEASGIAVAHTFTTAGTFLVALRVTDSDGAQTIITVAIEITDNQPPVAVLSGPSQVVSGTLASFDGSASKDADGKIAKLEWDFTYDGTTFQAEASTALASRTYTAAEAGIVTVALQVTDDKGAIGLTTQQVAVKTQAASSPPPQASFSSPASVREGTAALFDGSASSAPGGSITAREWDFEYDQTTFAAPAGATGIAPSHAYPTAGTYLVAYRVTASYPDGSTATVVATRSIVVTPNLPPTAVLTGAQSGKVGVPVAFDAAGSTDADGTIQSYNWDFSYNVSDGFIQEASGVGTSHAFDTAGAWVVALQVTDNDTTATVATQTVNIAANQSPVAAFVAPSSGVVGKLGELDGSGSADSDGVLVKHEWDLDYDGTTFGIDKTGVVINHAFASAKTFTVALRVTDDLGAQALATRQILIQTVADSNPPPSASLVGPSTLRVNQVGSFDGSGSSSQAGTIVSYEWDFGFGGDFASDATGAVQTHSYGTAGTVVVALRVTAQYADQSTKSSTATQTVQVTGNQIPVADFSSPASVRINGSAALDGSLSQDADGTLTSYEWDFDYDGVTFTTPVDASGALAGPSYATPGTRTLALRVTDSDGAQSLKTRSLEVTPNQPPVASFTGPSTVRVSQAATFDASAAADPDGTLTAYAWDFDYDGTFVAPPAATTVVASASYATPGVRVVALRVTDSDGATALVTLSVDVRPNQPPTASFTGPQTVRVGQVASFDGSGSSDLDGSLTLYQWDLDYDGATFGVDATGPVASKSYASAGQKVVALRVTDNDNAVSAIATQTISVVANVPPVAQISGPAEADLGTPTGYDGSASFDPDGSVVTWQWDLDYDGTTFTVDSSSKAPSFTFSTAKTYVVALRVTDNEGATNLATKSVAANELNQLSLTAVSPANGPRFGGNTVTLTGTAFTGGTTVQVDGSFAGGVVAMSSTTLTFTAPAGLPGPADIRVFNANGDVTLTGGAGGYTYDGASNQATTGFCWFDATTGSVVLTGGIDDGNQAFALPFAFGYFGVLYPAGSSMNVCSNGWMSFSDLSSAFQDFAVPSGSNPLNMIAPFFFDQAIRASGAVFFETFGTTPNRQLVVQWEDATDAGSQTDRYFYQAVLYEGSYDIKLQYMNLPRGDTNWTNDRENATQATLGVQGPSAFSGTGFSSNTLQAGMAPGGRAILFSSNQAGTAYTVTSDLTLSVLGSDINGLVGSNFPTFRVDFSRAIDPTTIVISNPAAATDTVKVYRNSNPNIRILLTVELNATKDRITITFPDGIPDQTYTLEVNGVATPQGHVISQDPVGLGCPSAPSIEPYVETFMVL
jgi:PKD repeat protein